jgi:WD40 repeat protein
VWDWRAETYVLKQQGHYHDVSAVAYSPDGAMMATGADDAKVGSSSPLSQLTLLLQQTVLPAL